jgi:hypothetical protein
MFDWAMLPINLSFHHILLIAHHLPQAIHPQQLEKKVL